MINLEKFLNNGGKRYRVSSKTKVRLNLSDTLTLSPASDEFVVFFSESSFGVDCTTARTTLTDIGYNQVGVPVIFGVGESVTFSYSKPTQNGTTEGEAYIYEEDV